MSASENSTPLSAIHLPISRRLIRKLSDPSPGEDLGGIKKWCIKCGIALKQPGECGSEDLQDVSGGALAGRRGGRVSVDHRPTRGWAGRAQIRGWVREAPTTCSMHLISLTCPPTALAHLSLPQRQLSPLTFILPTSLSTSPSTPCPRILCLGSELLL
ncbi:hypothetical protein E2C01_006109 [Portunus trituberculatus]|uniref:Uncharacterized protein n=1 Tax=Portunus trituberculatus TaxID=210409 RepID=A0A5B7CUA2_PORTR|nr:hypothetical protein [Portunus trituberculatus]